MQKTFEQGKIPKKETVDAEFLKESEGWRDTLARNIALRNKGLSSDDLNAAVQATIDRVVFFRMAEDRGLEPSGQLLKLCERDGIYSRFMRTLCRKADEKYNSGLLSQRPTGFHLPTQVLQLAIRRAVACDHRQGKASFTRRGFRGASGFRRRNDVHLPVVSG
jgi:hypothetical protein